MRLDPRRVIDQVVGFLGQDPAALRTNDDSGRSHNYSKVQSKLQILLCVGSSIPPEVGTMGVVWKSVGMYD